MEESKKALDEKEDRLKEEIVAKTGLQGTIEEL